MQCRKTPARSARSSFRSTTDIMYEPDARPRTMTALVRENTAVGSRPEAIFIQGRKSRVKREGLFGD
jgi:hypothetical protein